MTNLLQPVIIGILPENLDNELMILIILTILATLVILFIAEFIPKVLFRINPNYILNIFAIPVFVFYIVIYPVIVIFIGLGELILRLFPGIKHTEKKYIFSVADLDNYIKEFTPEGTEEKTVTPEIQMFQNVIDFRNIKLRECMVPRPEIIAIEKNDSVEELRNKFSGTGFSKILIYRNSIDDIIGYTHTSDLFKNPGDIKSITRSIIYVPETMLANNVLSMFIQQHKSIAVVVDEFGGTSGLVTMEDIIEEIFGEIEDEHDDEDLVDKVLGNNEYLFSGRLEIDYINDKYTLQLPESEDYETLAGMIIHYHESIPKLNEQIRIKNFTFTIIQASENRIDQVRLKIQ